MKYREELMYLNEIIHTDITDLNVIWSIKITCPNNVSGKLVVMLLRH